MLNTVTRSFIVGLLVVCTFLISMTMLKLYIQDDQLDRIHDRLKLIEEDLHCFNHPLWDEMD